MNTFVIDPRLATDSHLIGQFPLSQVRLMNNSLFPWLILVPQVQEVEIHHLDTHQQNQLLEETTTISRFIENTYKTDKINTGAIGNIVRQMHIHIIGRYETDACWPGVVWGTKQNQAYTSEQVAIIAKKLQTFVAEQTQITYIAYNS